MQKKKNKDYKEVLLPFGQKILQHKNGQSISSDIEYLNKYIINNYENSKKNVLDLGCGNGIIPIMLSHYKSKWNFTGIDIQKDLVELAKLNTQNNHTIFFKEDLKDYTSTEKFDIIVSNPPYFKKYEGRLSPNKIRQIARHEVKCNLYDVLNCIKRNLKKCGKAILLYPESRELDIENNLKKIDLKLVKSLLVYKKKKQNKGKYTF